MIDTPSQEPAAPGPLPGPQHATGGLAAKWKAFLFMAGVLLLFPLTLGPTNWLSERGLLQGRAAWTAAIHWGAFLAVLVPTAVAAWCEGQPMGSFGLAWRAGRGRPLAEGVAWGSVPRAFSRDCSTPRASREATARPLAHRKPSAPAQPGGWPCSG